MQRVIQSPDFLGENGNVLVIRVENIAQILEFLKIPGLKQPGDDAEIGCRAEIDIVLLTNLGNPGLLHPKGRVFVKGLDGGGVRNPEVYAVRASGNPDMGNGGQVFLPGP